MEGVQLGLGKQMKVIALMRVYWTSVRTRPRYPFWPPLREHLMDTVFAVRRLWVSGMLV